MKITITGASDDLIEIDGDISEEFQSLSDKGPQFLVCSDGTLLSIEYDRQGIWRVNRLREGSASYSKIEGDYDSDTFDVVTLSGDIHWVLLGAQLAKGQK